MMDFIHLNVWLDLIIFITSESFYYCLKVIHYMYLKGILIFVLPVNFQLQDQSTYVYVFHIIGIQIGEDSDKKHVVFQLWLCAGVWMCLRR